MEDRETLLAKRRDLQRQHEGDPAGYRAALAELAATGNQFWVEDLKEFDDEWGPAFRFALDTSGGVVRINAGGLFKITEWSDLSPFAQGYAETALRELNARLRLSAGFACRGVGFSDLHPEALAMVLRDCEVYCAGHHRKGVSNSETEGGSFWRIRQSAGYVRDGRFPPLRVYLDDAGKVRLEDAR